MKNTFKILSTLLSVTLSAGTAHAGPGGEGGTSSSGFASFYEFSHSCIETNTFDASSFKLWIGAFAANDLLLSFDDQTLLSLGYSTNYMPVLKAARIKAGQNLHAKNEAVELRLDLAQMQSEQDRFTGRVEIKNQAGQSVVADILCSPIEPRF